MKILVIILGYLLGSISPSYFISKAKGHDIRDIGSGNAGASNVTVSYGWKWGVFTALFDIFKAFITVYIARALCHDDDIAMIAGVAAVIGHMFPFYMQFKGGKGYASVTGLVLALNWKLALIMMGAGVLITLLTGYIALATITSVIVYSVYFFVTGKPLLACVLFAIMSVIIIYKHKINIERIINGTEISLMNSNKHRVDR